MLDRSSQPQAQPTPTPCTPCNGAGGIVETTRNDGVLLQTWHPCQTCGGSGRTS